VGKPLKGFTNLENDVKDRLYGRHERTDDP